MKLYTSKAIAAVLDMTDRNVRKLKAKGVIREAQPGLYDLIPTVNAYINYLRGDNKDGETYTMQRARLAAAKAEMAEMEAAARRGELHETTEIELALTTLITNLRTQTLALPAKLAPMLARLDGDEAAVYDTLRAALEETLNTMSRYDVALKLPEGDDDGAKNPDAGRDGAAGRAARPTKTKAAKLRKPSSTREPADV